MNTKKFIICLLFLILNPLDLGPDFDDYQKLEIQNVSSITREDLPSEFSDEALKTVDEFIRKTRNLNYECALFFDYGTGEILKFAKGINDNVKLEFEHDEFSGNHVASIHNHPNNVFGPPSGKNFNVLSRHFEDYELVVGRDGLWILKAKGVHKSLIKDFREASDVFYIMVSIQCDSLFESIDEIDECNDNRYGDMLLNYINNKNINDIQLMKREYEDD